MFYSLLSAQASAPVSCFLYGVGTLIGIFSVGSVLSGTCPCHATKGVFAGVVWEGASITTLAGGREKRGLLIDLDKEN